MSAQTDVDFVLFLYTIYPLVFSLFPALMDRNPPTQRSRYSFDGNIMVFASEEEGMFVFGRVLSLVGLVILFGLEVHFVDEDIEIYMRKHDFTLK
jgi:hypothetical protein